MVTACSLLAQLQEYEEELAAEGIAKALEAAAQKAPVIEEGGAQFKFLHMVLLPLLDTDRNCIITRSELHALQLLGNDFAKQVAKETPATWPELLDAIYMVAQGRGKPAPRIMFHAPQPS